MRRLIEFAPKIAGLDGLFEDGDVELSTRYGWIDASWFVAHLGHELVPINEYGHIATEEDR